MNLEESIGNQYPMMGNVYFNSIVNTLKENINNIIFIHVIAATVTEFQTLVTILKLQMYYF